MFIECSGFFRRLFDLLLRCTALGLGYKHFHRVPALSCGPAIVAIPVDCGAIQYNTFFLNDAFDFDDAGAAVSRACTQVCNTTVLCNVHASRCDVAQEIWPK